MPKLEDMLHLSAVEPPSFAANLFSVGKEHHRMTIAPDTNGAKAEIPSTNRTSRKQIFVIMVSDPGGRESGIMCLFATWLDCRGFQVKHKEDELTRGKTCWNVPVSPHQQSKDFNVQTQCVSLSAMVYLMYSLSCCSKRQTLLAFDFLGSGSRLSFNSSLHAGHRAPAARSANI